VLLNPHMVKDLVSLSILNNSQSIYNIDLRTFEQMLSSTTKIVGGFKCSGDTHDSCS